MVTAKAVSRGGNNRGYSNGTQQVVNIWQQYSCQ
jgi:hypothetical protein